jgi:hypothetical membrane protein
MINSNSKILDVLFFTAAVQFLLSIIIAEALYPGYSIANNYISDLGVGPSALLFNTSLLVLGALIIIGTYYLHRILHVKIFTAFLAIAAVGCICVGVFTEHSEPMHSIASSIVFFFGGLSVIVSFRWIQQPFSYVSLILGVISLGALFLFGIHQYLGLGVGGMERMIVYPILAWMMGFSGYLSVLTEKS